MATIDPRNIRRLWLIAGSAIAVVVLGFSALQTVSVLAHEEETLTTDVDQPISVVDIENEAGSIEVVGTDDDQVTVTAHLSDGLTATHHSIEVDGDRLLLRASCPWLSTWCDADFVVEAPPDVDVVARSDHGPPDTPFAGGGGGGSITVHGIEGDLDLATDHGNIVVTGAAGELTPDSGSIDVTATRSDAVTASSAHGNVEVEFVDPPDSVVANTDHGNVRIVVPDDATVYRVDVSTDHGTPESDVDSSRDAEHTITAHSDHGDVSVTYTE